MTPCISYMKISLGLVHLHSIRIVHGDLKGVSFLMYRTTHACYVLNILIILQLNILIDDSTKSCPV